MFRIVKSVFNSSPDDDGRLRSVKTVIGGKFTSVLEAKKYIIKLVENFISYKKGGEHLDNIKKCLDRFSTFDKVKIGMKYGLFYFDHNNIISIYEKKMITSVGWIYNSVCEDIELILEYEIVKEIPQESAENIIIENPRRETHKSGGISIDFSKCIAEFSKKKKIFDEEYEKHYKDGKNSPFISSIKPSFLKDKK